MYVRESPAFRLCLAVIVAAAALAVSGRDPAVVAQQVRDGAAQTPRDGQLAVGQAARRVASTAGVDSVRVRALLQAAREGLDYVPGEALVRFRAGKTATHNVASMRALEARTSARLVRWSGDMAVVRDPAISDGRRLAAALSAEAGVAYAEPNYLVRLPARGAVASVPMSVGRTLNAVPDDPDFGLQWNFSSIGMPEAWDINPGGRSDLIVAVVDSGVNNVDEVFLAPLWTGSAFEEFELPVGISPQFSSARLVHGRDFALPLLDDATVIDTLGHGTHVASTIAQATNDGVALAGIAYNVQIMPVKVCFGYWEVQILSAVFGDPGFAPVDTGLCPTDAIIDGLLYAADMGAQVINLSLGGPGQSLAERDAVQYAVNRGAFVAMSMGNLFEIGNPVEYPAGFAPDIAGAMSVAAFGRSRNHAFYSNAGPHAEIAAPGGDTRDAGASGLVYQTTLRDADISPFLLVPRFDRYANEGMQGTSMATPHVAGMAALLMSQVPGLSPAMVERVLIAAAEDLGPPGRDDEFGYGALRARLSLFGFGIRR